MMDDFLLYSRLALHLITAGLLLSYRCRRTSKPLVSLLAALITGASLSLAAHVIFMRPESHQFIALTITAAVFFVIVRSNGNLAKVFQWRKLT